MSDFSETSSDKIEPESVAYVVNIHHTASIKAATIELRSGEASVTYTYIDEYGTVARIREDPDGTEFLCL